MNLDRATEIAERVKSRLAPHCVQIEVAGSVRRRRPQCGDIDIVLQPTDAEARAAIEVIVRERCEVVKNGPELLCAHMANGVQLDFWFAHGPVESGDLLEKRTTPGNFGSVLLCRTGSKEHNIALVEHAKVMGLRWHPHDGVMRGDRVIASETEADIFKALSLRFIPVECREPGWFSYPRWMRVNTEVTERRGPNNP